MNKQQSIKNLSIITPFKEKSNKKLIETISCLHKQKLNISINHLILYDDSCSKIYEIKEIFPQKDNYFLKLISINKKGIYKAINEGLDNLKKGSYYIVLGAGDLLFLNDIKKIRLEKMLICKYRLSGKKNTNNNLRNIYAGMPYCHNAIIFKVNHLRYTEKFSISSDYDYFLKFLKYEQINLLKKENFNKKITIVFESESGVSTRSFFKKNYENLSIILKNQGLKYIFVYIFLNIQKLIKRTYV